MARRCTRHQTTTRKIGPHALETETEAAGRDDNCRHVIRPNFQPIPKNWRGKPVLRRTAIPPSGLARFSLVTLLPPQGWETVAHPTRKGVVHLPEQLLLSRVQCPRK